MAFVTPTIPMLGVSSFTKSSNCINARNRFDHRFATASCNQKVKIFMTATSPNSNTSTPSVSTQTQKETEKSQFDWYETWYPIMIEADIVENKAHRFVLWDTPYVIFKNVKDGSYVVMDDVCPHRLAPLSEGRLVNEKDPKTGEMSTTIECGYHGWTFDCSGTCTNIPNSMVDAPIPSSAKVRTYPTLVSTTIIFMWTGSGDPNPPNGPVPEIILKAQQEGTYTQVRTVERYFPFPYHTLVENLIDPAHVPWSHHNVQGSRDAVKKGGKLKIVEKDIKTGSFYSNSQRNTTDSNVGVRLTFKAPGSVHYHINRSNSSLAIGLALWSVPTGKYTCKLVSINYMVNAPSKLKFTLKLLPRWISHTITNLVLDGDSVLLQRQDAYLNGFGEEKRREIWKSYLPTPWDPMVVEYRKWWGKVSYSEPYRAQIGTPMSYAQIPRRDVNNRYENHTKYCMVCRGALRNAKIVRLVSYVIASMGAATSLFASILTTALKNSGLGYSESSLRNIGIAGVVTVVLMFALLKLVSYIISLMTYTELAYEKGDRNVLVE